MDAIDGLADREKRSAEAVPCRVFIATRTLAWLERCKQGPISPLGYDTPRTPQELSDPQRKLENAAMSVLLRYLLGEDDFRDVGHGENKPDDDAPPASAPARLPEPVK